MATYIGDDSANLYIGADGVDDISGLGGNDTLDGGGARDIVRGGAGNDLIYGGVDTAIDTLDGGSGNDIIFGKVKDRLFGGRGTDYFNLVFDTATPYDVDLASLTVGGAFTFADGGKIDGFESGDIYFSTGADRVVTSNDMVVRLHGRGGDDTLTGRNRNDYLDGGADASGDNDVLSGGKGGDTIHGGPGDILDGGSETSTGDGLYLDLSASSFAYDVNLAGIGDGAINLGDGTRLEDFELGILTFGANGDRVRVGATDGFIIQGGGGDDTLTGGSLSDDLDGGDGDDVIDGGAGSDDAAYFWNALVGVNVSLLVSGPQDTGVGLDSLIRIEDIVGSQNDDQIIGSNGGNTLGGLNGDDTLNGGGGDDLLVGGYDSTSASDDDRIIGSSGSDTMTGGAGADVFVYLNIANSTVVAPDQITDLQVADVIDLSAIDADTTTPGDRAFVIVGAFSGAAGEAQLTFDGVNTSLALDVDGDANADSLIIMVGDQTGFTNFVL